MKRRSLLGGMLSCALLRGEATSSIIDAHVHFYDPTRPGGIPWPTPKDEILYKPTLPGPWARMVKPLGVSGVIVVEASPWLEDNQWVLDLARENSIIAGTVGYLEPGKPEFRQHLARFGRNPLFRGLRLGQKALQAALENPNAMADLQRLAGAGLALDVIGDSEVLTAAARLSDAIPTLRIVVDHLPFEAPPDALQALKHRKQVFAKVSGVVRRVGDRVPGDVGFYSESLDKLWDVFGEDRVIYASNWPVSERIASYATVLRIVRDYFEGKGELAAGKYFRANSVTAYRLVTRG